MALELTQTIQNQIDNKDIKPVYVFKINSVDYTEYLIGFNISYSTTFGSASATFVLENDDGKFGEGGANKIDVGDIVEFIEKFHGDDTEFKKFYGLVNQRSIKKSSHEKSINLICLDYISSLQFQDIDLELEGEKVEITNETLTPHYLPEPNDMLAQVFDFDNNAIATDPMPILMIQDRVDDRYDPQYDGFEIYYSTGQVKLGSPLNVLNNYHLIARSYWFYIEGLYVEDIIETIICQPDGYGNYLFGASSAEDLLTNHLTETFRNKEGAAAEDSLTPNLTSSEISITHTVTSAINKGATSIVLDSVEGLPDSGTASINGDIFTWSEIESGTTLSGIPATGDNALVAHPANSLFTYTTTYELGRVWYLRYSNLVDDLDKNDFSFSEGSPTIDYIDKRNGRIILDAPISILTTVKYTEDYNFRTLQSTGITLNKISFRPREVENRFEAIKKVREYLASNYILRTTGNDKIWASYLSQRVTEDYTLNLQTDVTYLEDEDLYTRTKFYAKNRNPTNIAFNEGIDFSSTGESYKGLATQNELTYDDEEDGFYVYKSSISGVGYISLETITPTVYINGVAINNTVQRLVALPVVLEMTTRTVTRTGCHGVSSEQYVKTHTYYYYKIKFSHGNIEPTEPIYLYSNTGELVETLSPNTTTMDYGRGIWHVPGSSQNTVIESIATATYSVFYSTGDVIIDYDNVLFKIRKGLIPNVDETTVWATYEYWTVMIPVSDIASVIDGRWDTQVQIEFFSEPPSNYPLSILDLGAIYEIQAMDIVAGFFKPDEYRKFDIDFNFTLHYSLDGVNYYDISDKLHSVQISGGQGKSFEEDVLGSGFKARYIKILLEKVKKLDYRDGIWVVAFSELSLYGDIVLESETKLISTTFATDSGGVQATDDILNVEDTTGFTEPESAEAVTAYIDGELFTYTGLTATSFTGCTFESGSSYDYYARVSQSLEDDSNLYDDRGLLVKLKDRLYKKNMIDDQRLFLQSELDNVSKAYLEEFIKNHSRIQTSVVYAPYLEVGQTVKVVDTYNNINRNYFIESVQDSLGMYNLTLAYYPG